MKSTSKSTLLIFAITAISCLLVLVLSKSLFSETEKFSKYLKIGNKVNSTAPVETIQYGQLVGEWDCEIKNLNKDGTWIESKATWIFKYVLDGYAIQDFWINHGTSDPNLKKKELIGSNIRIYDPKQKIWKCTWMENGNNTMSGIWESYQNDKGELVLYDETGSWEIIFYNITKDSFDWKWDFKQDDGSMKTLSKIKARSKK
nr:hypothetical protein [uncultured Allomuricauda sp.]